MNRFLGTRQFFIAVLSALLFFFSSPFFSTTLLAAADFPTLSEEDYKALSHADRQDYEKRLKEHIESMSPQEQEAFMQQEVEKLYNSLPPEQQKEVLEEAARIEKMSEEEQRAYFKQVESELEEMFNQQQEQVAAPVQPRPTPEPELIPDEPKKKEVTAPQISEEEKALKEAVSLLNELAQSLDDLSTKMESMVNLQFKFSSWGKKKKISAWDGGFEWKKLKEKISTFRGQLEKLKDRDTTTKKHKYLPYLLENKALYTQLYNLSIDLAENEPTVRGGTNESVTKQVRARSNKALRALVKTFVDLFFSTKKDGDIISSINTIFVKFDPQAKKIAGKETKATQKALAESKQPVHQSSVKVAGTSRERESRYGGYGEDYSRGRDYGATPSGAYPSSGYGSPYGSPYGEESGKTSNLGESADKAGGSKSGGEKTVKETEIKKDDRFLKLLKTFDRNVEAILDTLTFEESQLDDLTNYVKSGKVDTHFAEKLLPDLNGQIKKATKQLTGLMEHIKPLPSATKTAYKKDIKTPIDSIKKDIEKLVSTLGSINETQAKTPDMKWAHFKIAAPKEKIVKTPAQPGAQPAQKSKALEIEHPISFTELKKSAQDFLSKVEEFNRAS